MFARTVALAGAGAFGWLFYSASRTDGNWWTSTTGVALVATLLGSIPPATAFISSWAKLRLEAQKQEHEIEIAKTQQRQQIDAARADQEHAITTDYLGRTLNIDLPLATRHQLLRFLATDPRDSTRLQKWAQQELIRIDSQFEQYTREVQAQHEAIAKAKDVGELRLAEAKLKALSTRAASAQGKPAAPNVTVEALLAGFFTHQELGELSFPGASLDEMIIWGSKLAGSDFSNARLREAGFNYCNLRLCRFDGADLKGADLTEADCRGATFVEADLQGATLTRARLEGADLSQASLDRKRLLQAVYDTSTKWPEGFDPAAAGCVLISEAAPPEPTD